MSTRYPSFLRVFGRTAPLLGRYKQMKSSGGEAVYCRAGKQVSRILRVGGLEKLLKGFESLEEAVEEREET